MINEKKLKTMRLILAALKEKWLDPESYPYDPCPFCNDSHNPDCSDCLCPKSICRCRGHAGLLGFYYGRNFKHIHDNSELWINICRSFQTEYLKLKAEVKL